ncbi:hypothetical protein F5148DRAFT_1282610 [Russula earlei]|uniref:Uncharacterized protein n=1 Tax=Russula earlei TaxID=71964 RepID=A0ACC0UE29_9AGAM|nr:hypothetical protein F5148DRAFT_1282610 [Russula earlei]
MRVATSVLCKEMLRPGQTTGLGIRESEEVEQRMRALARLERVWGKSGASASGSVTQLAAVGSTLGASASAAGEERERRLFSEALRDGYVLCHCGLDQSHGLTQREDGKLRMSNVTKFLASCSAHGLSPHDLFLRDDLIEATSDSLARVAKTVIALVKWAETPATPTQSQLLRGKSKLTPINTSALKPSGANAPLGSPYRFSSRAAMSSPNLSPHSPPGSPRSPTRNNTRRWTPSPGLPTLRFASPAPPSSSSHAETALGTETDRPEISARTSNRDEVPPIVPPRSPRRSRPSERSLFASGAGESLAPPFGESVRVSVADSTTNQSIASSNLTDTTTYSSLFDSGIGNRRNSGAHGKFGTIRTVTTEATSFVPSEWPSMTRTEASAVASFMVGSEDNLGGNDGNNHSPSTTTPSQRRRSSLDSPVRSRERKPSETIPVDLTRVVEESEEPASVGDTSRVASRGALPTNGRIERIKLKQGKWPDDFLDVFQAQNYVPSRPISIKRSSLSPLAISVDAPAVSHDDLTLADLDDLSASPSEPESQLPTLVTQRARHSVDAPVLAPKDPLHPRDSSPDPATHCSGLVPAGRVALRRNNTRAGITGQRNGIYVARRCSPEGATERDDSDLFVAIPFPPASTERGSRTVSGSGSVGSGSTQLQPLRGRFQSEADGSSSRRRPRPNSYDEFGVKPRRSRFESMVNLGAAAGEHASASDLMARDATEGSISRQTLVVREEGKSPIHYQLGNCIGRGQFGSVYRALNLNTGQMVAVKRIGLEGLKEEEIAQLMREVDLVKRLSHPSIVKYEGMARDENTLSIVLEYAENGSLGQTLKAFGKLNEKLVASYVVKILEGLDYLHRSDVVHCDLKAANILTTKNGNVKLSDFGVSLNLRAMEREIKDVAGTPNWMAPEVIELKGASTRSDIWSLGCTVIELLTGRPPYGDIANAMTVEDDCPPIPDRFSDPLVAFLKECFHKDLTQRPSAEELFEHEWLKNHWGLNKDLRPQDSIPFLRRVSADLQKNDAARHLIANLDPPLPEFARDEVAPSSSPGRRSFTTASPGIPIPEAPQAEPDIFDMREHTFVKTTFSKPVGLIAHVKCAGRAPPTCDLRSKLLMHAHLAERGSPTDIFARLPPPPSGPASDGVGATSSRGSLDRERANSPSLSASSPTHPPVAYKALSPFKRSHASPSPDPPHSNSSVSLAGGSAPQKQQQGPVKSLLTESSVIRRKLSIILTRQRETNARSRPLSISSIGSSSPQTDSIRSLQTPPESISSRAARVDTSISGATESSTDANPAVLSASVHSGASTVPDGVRESSPMAADASSAPPSTSVAAPVVTVQDTHRTKRGRGGSKSSNCAIQ